MKIHLLDARLLSMNEYLQNIEIIGTRKPCMWRQDACLEQSDLAAAAYSGTEVGYYEVDYVFSVVPALVLQESDLPAGTKLTYARQSFTILPTGLALCDKPLAKLAFREDWKAKDANSYQNSDVKRTIDSWFFRHGDTAEIIN